MDPSYRLVRRIEGSGSAQRSSGRHHAGDDCRETSGQCGQVKIHESDGDGSGSISDVGKSI